MSIEIKNPSYSYRQEEIADIMCHVDHQPHHREMEAVAERDQRHRDVMVNHELSEILSSRLEPEDHDERLICPERGLEEIVELRDC